MDFTVMSASPSSSHNASDSNTPSDRQCDFKKIIYDPIHKLIKLHPVWVRIIDTPEFQRLRYIKQLGCSFFVYPSATHTRFEHSIGVCFLAWRMAKTLQKQLGEELVTKEDVLCVSIAGLCHDLGHGPFSHTWELFMARIKPGLGWKHESMSIEIFERIWKKLENKPNSLWKQYNLDETHQIFIRDLICGDNSQADSPYFKNKNFLFEIVANKKNGVDVDKWDYFARDAYYVGTNMSFDHERLLHVARALDGPNGEKSIHYRNTEIMNFYHMFYIRFLLHQRIYQHKVGRIIDRMIVDALVEANEILKDKKLSDYVNKDNVHDFLKLNDSIFHLILELSDPCPKAAKARRLIERIQARDLYRCVGCAVTSKINDVSVKKIEPIVVEMSSLSTEDFYIDVVDFNYGKKQDDPVKEIPVYNKDGNVIASKDCVPSLMLTNTFAEQKILFVCYKSDNDTQRRVKKAFEIWFEKYKIELGLSKSC